MSTTESDINIDTDEVHEVFTTDLKGDKIERLLYKSGLDSEHKVGEEGVSLLEVKADNLALLVSETWEADGEWYIDPAAIVIDIYRDDILFRTYFPDAVETEEDLVEYIEDMIEYGAF